MTVAPIPVIPLRPHTGQTTPGGNDVHLDPPEWLTETGKAVWQRLAPHCNPTAAEQDSFAAYVEAIAEYQDANDIIRETGIVVIDQFSGQVIPSPATGIRDRADKKLAYWAQRFNPGR